MERANNFINRQRTLIFASKRTDPKTIRLCEELQMLLPHSKNTSRVQEEEHYSLSELVSISKMFKCPNCLFFRSENKSPVLYLAKCPNGPTVKFQVSDFVSFNQLNMTGNCLLGSRPILHFDRSFESNFHMKLIKELLVQSFATPNGHPKSKPFVDHVFSFFCVGEKIYFRNYQVITDGDGGTSTKKKDRVLRDIGPRFCLTPCRVLDGAFSGKILFNNESFVPNAIKSKIEGKRKRKVVKMKERKRRKFRETVEREEVELDAIFKMSV